MGLTEVCLSFLISYEIVMMVMMMIKRRRRRMKERMRLKISLMMKVHGDDGSGG